jgi:hypothetical protein
MTENKNSMTYWWPKIKGLKIPMPQTVFVPVTFTGDGDCLSEETHKIVESTAYHMGYPVFIKTDLCAGKHDYDETCYVPDKEHIHFNLERLRDDNFCKDLMFTHFAVRRYIELAWQFKAFRDLPIAPERRYFIDDGNVICRHPYWPEDAIEFYNLNIPEDPRRTFEESMALRESLVAKRKEETLPLLREMNVEHPQEINILTDYSEMVARVLPGYWSVDFALGRDKKWYLIDMAEGERSYHSDDCLVKQMKDGLL